MPQMLHRFRLFAAVTIAVVSPACIPHAGEPTGADRSTWQILADDACERGDHSAYEALAARAGDDEPDDCVRGPIRDDTMLDDRD